MNPLTNEREEDWLGALLRIKIGNCEEHQDLKFNEKNVFCVDCAVSFCRYCKEAHSLHHRFQIYKYCYHDVVRHSDLHKYFDCSNIQTYISNNDKIVHLKPRPSSKDIKLAKRSKAANRSLSLKPKKPKHQHLQNGVVLVKNVEDIYKITVIDSAPSHARSQWSPKTKELKKIL
ncbi:hypothetical protein SESBI_15858 [Sesbania bispinosa]|nr:hypothetical protein SESBI_15858 [Sesbania bispinosa]